MLSQLMHGVFAASLSSALITIIFIAARRMIILLGGALWLYYIWFSIFIPWIAVWIPWYFWTIGAVFRLGTLAKTILPAKLTHSSLVAPLFFLLTNGSKYSLILAKIFLIIWILGIMLCLIYISLRHGQFVANLKRHSRLITGAEQEIIKASLTSRQHKFLSRIYLSSLITSPMLCHFLQPKIYLPQDFFQNYTRAEQKYVLQHEYFHFKRGDLIANISLLILGCVNWFNPIVFWAYRYFRHAQELSCDAMISKRFTAAEKKAYGYALLKTATYSSSAPVSCWWNTGIELKERFQMLKINHSKPSKALVGIVILFSTMLTIIAAASLETRDALFAYSILSAESSDFVIKLFNNTALKQPLHYSIKSPGQEEVKGELAVGDDNGEFITINGFFHDAKTADITLASGDHIVWKGTILFSGKRSEFSTRTFMLDSHLNLGTNIFQNLHAITFDLMQKKRE